MKVLELFIFLFIIVHPFSGFGQVNLVLTHSFEDTIPTAWNYDIENMTTQIPVIVFSGGSTLIFPSFKHKAESITSGFDSKIAKLGNANLEIQFRRNAKYFSSVGGTLFLNGYKYSHIVKNDSFVMNRHTSLSYISYGLFSKVGYQFIYKNKVKFLGYAGLKGCYGMSNFQLYIPIGLQAGLHNKKNKSVGISAEYNLLLNPQYEVINVSYPFNGIVEPYTTEIRSFNNFLNLSLYFSFPLLTEMKKVR